MAKNAPKSGRSARRGNKPSPYTKYRKSEYKYSGDLKAKHPANYSKTHSADLLQMQVEHNEEWDNG